MNRMYHDLFSNKSGLTLIELVIALALMGILAAAVLPMAELTVKRTKELELRRVLRQVRTAIDAYHDDYLKAVAEKKIFATIGETGYPESLELLTKGIEWGGLYPYKKRYLRQIPKDPFDKYDEGWLLRSYIDDADTQVWGGRDIYDIHSQSDELALDGSTYREW